jgi:hypothetical protein
MLAVPPLSPAYPVIKPGKIKKNDPFSEQLNRKKKQVLAEPETQPIQHIDEVV